MSIEKFPDDVLLQAALQAEHAAVIDHPERVRLNSASWWTRLVSYRQKRHLDAQVGATVRNFFQRRYAFEDAHSFRQVWRAVGGKVWKAHSPLTSDVLRAIDGAFRQRLVYHGAGMAAPAAIPDSPQEACVQQLVKALLHGEKLTKKTVTKTVLHAVWVKHDAEMMRLLRQELQRELDVLAESPPKTPEQEIVWQAFLGNILALLPYSYPSTGDVFILPVLQSGECRRVEYGIEVLPLTPATWSTPMTALGMVPKGDMSAPPILSFIGTTFPAGDGFAATLRADATPGMSVGEAVYQSGKEIIQKWLAGKAGIYVTGMSLGGAMALHMLRHHEDQLAKVVAYSPPGLNVHCWEKEYSGPCQVTIYSQAGDIVPRMGYWPTGSSVALYRVLSHHSTMPRGMLSAHMRAYTGLEKLTILRSEPEEENRGLTRKFLTGLHRYLGPVVLFLPVTCCMLLYRAFAKARH